MPIYELIIHLPNEPGKLSEISGILGANDINIRAMDIALTGIEGILSLVVDNHSKGVQVCRSLGFDVREREVLAVWVPDHPGGLNMVLKPLYDSQIIVDRLYLAACRNNQDTMVIIEVSDIEASKLALLTSGVNLINSHEGL